MAAAPSTIARAAGASLLVTVVRGGVALGAVTAGDIASGIGVLFLGASTVCFSVLMYRSGYVPRAIGARHCPIALPGASCKHLVDNSRNTH